MAKPKSKKRAKLFKSTYVLWGTMTVLVFAQFASFMYIGKLWQYVSSLEERNFAGYINEVEARRYKNAVVDVTEQKAYLPEVRMYIPQHDFNAEIMYEVSNMGPEGAKNLYISLRSVVGNQRAVDVHSCDKMIWMSSRKLEENSSYDFVKEVPPTQDGLAYIYLHKKDNCRIYSDETWEIARDISENIYSY